MGGQSVSTSWFLRDPAVQRAGKVIPGLGTASTEAPRPGGARISRNLGGVCVTGSSKREGSGRGHDCRAQRPELAGSFWRTWHYSPGH